MPYHNVYYRVEFTYLAVGGKFRLTDSGAKFATYPKAKKAARELTENNLDPVRIIKVTEEGIE